MLVNSAPISRVFYAFFSESLSPTKRDKLMRCIPVHVWELVDVHLQVFMKDDRNLSNVAASFERQGHHMLSAEAWDAFIHVFSKVSVIPTVLLDRIVANLSTIGTSFTAPVATAIIEGVGWQNVTPEQYYGTYGTTFGDFWKSLYDARVEDPNIMFDGFEWELPGSTYLRDNHSLFKMIHLNSRDPCNFAGFLALSKIATPDVRHQCYGAEGFITPIQKLYKAIETRIDPPWFSMDGHYMRDIVEFYGAQ